MNTPVVNTPAREAARNGLATVGFLALVVVGMWLAIYAARFVPTAVNGLGAAAVYLGSVFTPSPTPSLSVVPPTASTTLPFDGATTTAATTTAPSSSTPTKSSAGTLVTPTAGKQTSSVTQISGTAATPSLYGLPDLAVTIDRVGYLATSSAESFVASSTVPHGMRPAVEFTVRNVGTNVSSVWSFTATIPTQTSYVYTAPNQQKLNPGDSIQFTLGFDQANAGANQKISLHLNPGGSDANTANNDASTTLTILGS